MCPLSELEELLQVQDVHSRVDVCLVYLGSIRLELMLIRALHLEGQTD